MAFNYILPLRIVQAVLALTVLISAAIFVNGDASGSGEGGFMVFNPIFTFLALGYLVAAPLWVQSIHNEWAVLVVEAVCWILWYCPSSPSSLQLTDRLRIRLAGFASMAARITEYSCVTTGDQLCSTISAGKAAAALGAFEWLAFSGSLGLVIYGIVVNRQEGGEEAEEGQVGYGMEGQQQPQQVPQQQMYQQQQVPQQQVYQQGGAYAA
ncbi:hypothetical protein BDD12DRAFT_760012 [Trichophaea hybrida]|nr:hypothetical protein BDD12DRAFT_760012 [Trichophaea hybrida]